MIQDGVQMEGVTEYVESYEVCLCEVVRTGGRRLVVRALNEAGHNCTEVDLVELIAWLKANRPEMLAEIGVSDDA